MNHSGLSILRGRDALNAHLKTVRQSGQTIGFVPTMGALHAGHLSLVSLAGQAADYVVASIFVNPTQFAPGEDFESYPRNEEDDLAKLASVGCKLVYIPTKEEMYPQGTKTHVRVEDMSDLLDGVYRPHFFYGVTTVVARLFAHVQPDVAVFGEKDFQQLQIIRRMVLDLGLPIEIIGGPTGRAADGLALSSRNAYLLPDERRCAGALSACLHRVRSRIEAGGCPIVCCAEAVALLDAAGFQSVDYVTVVDPLTLLPWTREQGGEFRVLGAGWMGKTRLIDNL